MLELYLQIFLRKFVKNIRLLEIFFYCINQIMEIRVDENPCRFQNAELFGLIIVKAVSTISV